MTALNREKIRNLILGMLVVLTVVIFTATEARTVTDNSDSPKAEKQKGVDLESFVKRFELLGPLMFPVVGGAIFPAFDWSKLSEEGLSQANVGTHSEVSFDEPMCKLSIDSLIDSVPILSLGLFGTASVANTSPAEEKLQQHSNQCLSRSPPSFDSFGTETNT